MWQDLTTTKDKIVTYSISIGYLLDIFKIENDISLERKQDINYVVGDFTKLRILTNDENFFISINHQIIPSKVLVSATYLSILKYRGYEFLIPKGSFYKFKGKVLALEEVKL